MLLATFTFTLMKVCVKLIPHIPAIEIILFRSVISLIISVFYLHRQTLLTTHPGLLTSKADAAADSSKTGLVMTACAARREPGRKEVAGMAADSHLQFYLCTVADPAPHTPQRSAGRNKRG